MAMAAARHPPQMSLKRQAPQLPSCNWARSRMEWSNGEFSQISRKLALRRFPTPFGMKTQGVTVPSAQMPAVAVPAPQPL